MLASLSAKHLPAGYFLTRVSCQLVAIPPCQRLDSIINFWTLVQRSELILDRRYPLTRDSIDKFVDFVVGLHLPCDRIRREFD